MTKTLNHIIFFFLHQNQNIFFSNIGNQNIFSEKNHNPPFKLNGRSLRIPELPQNRKRDNELRIAYILHFQMMSASSTNRCLDDTNTHFPIGFFIHTYFLCLDILIDIKMIHPAFTGKSPNYIFSAFFFFRWAASVIWLTILPLWVCACKNYKILCAEYLQWG